MKIAYLTGEYPRATDTFILREVQALRKQGLDIVTCSVRTTPAAHHVGPEQKAEAAATFNVLAVAKNPVKLVLCHLRAMLQPKRYMCALRLALRTSPPGVRNHLFQFFYFLEAAVLADHLHQEGVDHLHNHIASSSCTLAMITSEMSGIPYSFTMHGPDIFFEPVHWRIDAKIATATFVACISYFCRSQAMIFSASQHWKKLHIIHCGVDPEGYGPGPRPERPTLLFVGRLAAVKGVPVLFEALTSIIKDHPTVLLRLIGDGPERQRLAAQAAAMNLTDHIEFCGYRSQSEVAEALSMTDVFVLPSFAEGVPVVLMEAMASGVPVVTSRIAGVPELVEDGVSGILVPPGTAPQLVYALNTLLKEAALREEMGRAGREKVKHEFNTENESKKLKQLFQQYGSVKDA
jgi:glycosyltransferase involved in cell wall biosynthesis